MEATEKGITRGFQNLGLHSRSSYFLHCLLPIQSITKSYWFHLKTLPLPKGLTICLPVPSNRLPPFRILISALFRVFIPLWVISLKCTSKYCKCVQNPTWKMTSMWLQLHLGKSKNMAPKAFCAWPLSVSPASLTIRSQTNFTFKALLRDL